MRTAIGLLLLLLAPLPGTPRADAHDFFLIPGDAIPGAGVPFDLAMHVSDIFPGAPSPWKNERVRDVFLVDGSGRHALRDAAVEGDPPRARVIVNSAGAAVIALTTTPSYIEISPGEFDAYLKHEGHEAIREARRASGAEGKPGRERYTRSVKTLVRAGGQSSPVALRHLGLPIEIVPESDPWAPAAEDGLSVRVFSGGMPYAGGYLCATHAGYSQEHDAYAWCGRLDDGGRARVPAGAPGWQLLRITRMVPLHGDPKADWESFWAALTYEWPAASRPAGARN
jgi:hypothetical protein